MEDSERIFTELIRSIERSRSELIRLIRDQEKKAVSRAEGRLERLEQEINDLRRRDAELEQLSHTQDHIQFLQVTQIYIYAFIYPGENLTEIKNLFSRSVLAKIAQLYKYTYNKKQYITTIKYSIRSIYKSLNLFSIGRKSVLNLLRDTN